jgi:hypothetical protein
MSLTLKARFRNKIRISLFIIGISLSIGISMAFAKHYNEFLGGFTVIAALIYASFIHKMVLDYVGLIASH